MLKIDGRAAVVVPDNTDTESLPPPDVIAAEIADDLEAALAQFAKIAERLSS